MITNYDQWSVLFLSVCGVTAPSDTTDFIQKITSGTDARKGSAPWLAQLWYVNKGTLFCLDIDGDEAHPHKQVHQHAEDDVAGLTELLGNLPALESQEEANQSK